LPIKGVADYSVSGYASAKQCSNDKKIGLRVREMDGVTIARAIHVLAIVHWIGGVTMVTLVMLPGLIYDTPAAQRLGIFELIEGRFAKQARVSTLLAGASGLYMTYRLEAWDRFLDLSFWWMDAMVLVWAIFTLALFVVEPFFLHRKFREHAERDPDGMFRLALRQHAILLTLSLVTIAGAVIGSHGGFY
jgi:uncharacterized membrane protein